MKISKKAGVALAVSAAFIATSALPAFAASQVDFSGFYRAQFYTHGNADGIKDSDKKTSDSWFQNRFRLNMNIQATDEISIHTRWQGPNDKKWGRAGDDNVQVKYAYGQIAQDWGNIFVGKINDDHGLGHAGLKSMGWDPLTVDGDEANYRPFDTGDGGDAIAYQGSWDNGFSLNAYYAKMKGEERYDKEKDDILFDRGNDHDWDRFSVEGIYKWDTGGASLAVAYDRDATGNGYDRLISKETGHDYNSATYWTINPAFMQTWGAFSTHAEAMFGFGKYNLKEGVDGENKISGQGFYLDFDYNYGPGRVNLAGWWASGNDYKDKANGAKQKSLPDGMGKGFAPLLVLYDGGGISTAMDNYTVDEGGIGNYGVGMANHWAIDLNGQHAFTDEITARWALAYAALNKASKYEDQKKDLGIEADFGIEAEILSNLHLYSGFGYLFAGDAFKEEGKDAKSPDDGYAFINSLYFNF